ncbi:MAG: hypothetical protein LJE92_06640 [Gammaproteobacteria bacterium]|jgi:hypothetical protein|nr:hypothetical protein [Gammaproteobacteria bacterium]
MGTQNFIMPKVSVRDLLGPAKIFILIACLPTLIAATFMLETALFLAELLFK